MIESNNIFDQYQAILSAQITDDSKKLLLDKINSQLENKYSGGTILSEYETE